MRANPVMKKLGLSETDRAVIFHADDIGSFQAAVAAYADLVEFGLLSAAAVMTPCAWFPAAAAYCRENQGEKPVDMGVHLTLTSEWDAFRWGPLSTRDAAAGLLDHEGYFHRTSQAVQEAADPAAVRQELRAQIERALAAGIDVTHIDSHMGTLFHERFLGAYLDLAREYRVPALMVRGDAASFQQQGWQPETAAGMAALVAALEAEGMPLLDHVHVMPLDRPQEREEQLFEVLEAAPPGITYLIVHPVKETPELKAAAWPADWPNRVADYHLFLSERVRERVAQMGLQVIGYRALRDLMRDGQ